MNVVGEFKYCRQIQLNSMLMCFVDFECGCTLLSVPEWCICCELLHAVLSECELRHLYCRHKAKLLRSFLALHSVL